MLSESIRDLKNTLAGKFDLLEQTLTLPDVWKADDKECDVLSDSDTCHREWRWHSTTADEPPSKKAWSTSSSDETTSKQKVQKNCKCRGRLCCQVSHNSGKNAWQGIEPERQAARHEQIIITWSWYLDIFINDGMGAIETMSFANYEINARRRECRSHRTWMRITCHSSLHQFPWTSSSLVVTHQSD